MDDDRPQRSINQQSTLQKVPLKEIQAATNNFEICFYETEDGERYYEGERASILGIPTSVFIKRYPEHTGHYLDELRQATDLQHPNVLSAFGYCNEKGEEILVYEYPELGILDEYLNQSNGPASPCLTWQQRLEICSGAAHGLAYLHSQDQLYGARDAYLSPERIIDDEDVELTKECNVYSFGMVLFEFLCGGLCTQKVNGYMLSAKRMREFYEKKKLYKIVDPVLRQEKTSSSSLEKYSAIAYQCLSYDPQTRPSMNDVAIELGELFNIESSIQQQSKIQKVSLKEIQAATNYFKKCIGKTPDGKRVYEGELSIFGTPTRVYITRYRKHTGNFSDDLDDSTKLQHPNVLSALGYCNEKGEEIMVYEYKERGSLVQYIRRSNRSTSTSLTWRERLEICAGAAHGLAYLHSQDVCSLEFRSASILLDDKWVAKVVDDAYKSPENISAKTSTALNNAYKSPESIVDDKHTEEGNAYTFGIILFEVLCGRLCTEVVDRHVLSVEEMKDLYKRKKVYNFVDPVLRQENISSSFVEKYSAIAYQCLSYDPKERPSMDDVAVELEEILDIERSINQQSTIQKVPLKEIQAATNNFEICFYETESGKRVYKGEKLSILGIPTTVLINRYPEHTGYYLNDLDVSTELQHPNVLSALGYCNEKGEEIMVYEYPERGSLDQYIRRSNRPASTSLTWRQRLEICAGAAHGLAFLHSQDQVQIDFQSSYILLDDKWVAKISDLEISTQDSTDVDAYKSPESIYTDDKHTEPTKESNAYTFGIILFEVLCGRLCTEVVDGYMLSAEEMTELYHRKKVYNFVDPVLRQENISSYTVKKYLAIADRCLSRYPNERPSMDDVAVELEEILDIELVEDIKVACHELADATNYDPDGSLMDDLIEDADRLVSCLAPKIPEALDFSMMCASSKCCEYVLNTLTLAFENKRLAHAVNQRTLTICLQSFCFGF
uniref:uncharacterized protein LOC122583644 n=1 Tax=Erigeron canadensis TaxID=72917 RepID=UPI001CB90CCE|nr:uncharacterized protein LOC122583644 [Erigeron canadensis]